MFWYAFRRLLRPIFWRVQFAAFSLLLLTIFVSTGLGASSFYVDPAWQGSHNGSPSQPWNQLTSAAWASINSALSNGNVTVYFAARPAGTNTDQVYDTAGDGVQLEIDLTTKTTNTSYFLTFDGKTLFNTNNSSPGWAASNGTNMCVVRDFNSENATHTKYSNIVIHGFRIVCNAGTKLVTICGDNWTVENCDASHTAAATDGPGILLVPTADGAHEGSSYWAPPCTNILIRSNVVHDTFGEAMYIGGGGSNPGSAGSGYPSHSNVTIENNVIYRAGSRGAQGDGIDIKGGIYAMVVRHNTITNLSGSELRAITCSGQTNGANTTTIIERNYISAIACDNDAAVSFGNTWGVAQGVIIRNNVIVGVTGTYGGRYGISIPQAQDVCLIANNTIGNCDGGAIGITAGSYILRNNIIFGCASDSAFGGTVDSDHNALSGRWGYANEGTNSTTVTDAAVTAGVLNRSGGDFHLAPGSAFIAVGQMQPGYTNDLDGTLRPITAVWDCGSYQHRPLPPHNIRQVP